jgi:hypothetical protein
MKILILLLFSVSAFAQQTTYSLLKVGDHAKILPSAIFEVKSTVAGMLLPRMTTTQKNAISSPAIGLLVFDTTLATMSAWNGASWQSLGTLSSIGTIDSTTPSANGAALVGTTLVLQSASSTNPGLINNSSQTFSGAKIFSNNPTFSSMNTSGVVLNSSSGLTSSSVIGNLTETTSDALNITGGSNAVIGSGLTLQVKQSTTSQDGYLSSSDWSTFNGKIGSLSVTAPVVLTGATLISIPKATTSQNGYFGSADWTAFNGKQSTLSLGTVTETTSSVLTLSSWTNATVGSPTITVKQATTSQSGYLSSTDWTTFNGKQATISVTAPVVLTGATLISIPKATTSQSGYLSSADWTTFSSGGGNFGAGLYSGIFNNGSGSVYWSNTNTSLGDFTANGAPAISQIYKSGFVTIGGAASNAPGITLTAPVSGTLEILVAIGDALTTANNGSWALTDGSNTIIDAISFHEPVTNAEEPATLKGFYDVTATSSYTFKVRGSIGSGTLYIGGDSTGLYLLSFTVKYVK